MGQSNRAQRYKIEQFVKFVSGERTKADVYRGTHFNMVVICLNDEYEITPHHEPYDVFFYVVSGKGIITAGEKQWPVQAGSMVFAPIGIRGASNVDNE